MAALRATPVSAGDGAVRTTPNDGKFTKKTSLFDPSFYMKKMKLCMRLSTKKKVSETALHLTGKWLANQVPAAVGGRLGPTSTSDTQ